MYPSYDAFCFGPFFDILGSIELRGFDVDVVDAVLSLEVEVVAASLGCINDDEVRKLILFGSKGWGCTVKLLTDSALAL